MVISVMAQNRSCAYIVPKSMVPLIMHDENMRENGIPFYHELNVAVGVYFTNFFSIVMGFNFLFFLIFLLQEHFIQRLQLIVFV